MEREGGDLDEMADDSHLDEEKIDHDGGQILTQEKAIIKTKWRAEASSLGGEWISAGNTLAKSC